jgi:hypothetical protein
VRTIRPTPDGHNKKGTAIDTNPTEDATPVAIPTDLTCAIARLDQWHAAIVAAAAHASTEASKPQLAGIRFDATPDGFQMMSTDSFGLARVDVPTTHPATIAATIPAKELAAAIAAAMKTHGRKTAPDVTGTLIATADAWTFRTDATSTSGRAIAHEFPNVTTFTAALDGPAEDAQPYAPTGWAADRLAHWIGTAKKTGAEVIEWHHWQSPMKPAAIRYRIGTGREIAVAVLMMPNRITR